MHLLGLPFEQQPRSPVDDLRVRVAQVALLVGVGVHVEQHHLRETMEGIVVGADAQPLVEAHRPLGGPRRAGQDQMVTAGCRGASQGAGETLPVPGSRDRRPQQLGRGGGHVDLVVQAAVDPSGLETGPPQHHRHPVR